MEEVILTEKDVPGAYLSKDPSEYHLPDLKRWLECHGQKKKGKLPEVVEKVCGCMALKLPVDPGVEGGKWYELKKKGDYLASASSAAKDSSSAANTPSDGWTAFPSVDILEMFNYGNSYHYLIKSIAEFCITYDYDSDKEIDSDDDSDYTTKEKPLRKRRKLIKSEFVVDLQDNSNDIYYFLRAHVHHSMKNEYSLTE